jgi:hypothetical protein
MYRYLTAAASPSPCWGGASPHPSGQPAVPALVNLPTHHPALLAEQRRSTAPARSAEQPRKTATACARAVDQPNHSVIQSQARHTSRAEYLRLTPRPQWYRTCARKIRFWASPHQATWPTRRLGPVDQLTVPLSTSSMLTRAAPMNAGIALSASARNWPYRSAGPHPQAGGAGRNGAR